MKRIGLYIHPWHAFGRDLLTGISNYIRERPDWECYSPWPGMPQWSSPAEWPLDGLILRTGGKLDPPRDFYEDLPRIIIGNSDNADVRVNVSWNNHAVGVLAADHLIEQGHRTIGFVGELESYPYQLERARGVQQRASQAGIQTTLFHLPYPGEVELEAFVTKLPRPAGIVAANDPIGRRVIHAARVVQRRVPEDLAVVGAGNDDLFCDLSAPPLSSVAMPGESAGYAAAVQLDALLNGEATPRSYKLEPSHVAVRRSSDSLAIDDPCVIKAMQIIRDQATSGLTVPEVIHAIPLSRRALELRFKKYVGRTIEREIRRVQIDRAKQMLRDTKASMVTIADRCGLSSSQRLSEIFAREQGESPSVYRHRMQSWSMS